MTWTTENLRRRTTHLLLHDAHLERRLGVLHRLADAHLGVMLGRLVHLRQHPLLLPLHTLLAGVLHALRLVAQSGHLLLGAGDDAQRLLHDGGAQMDGLLLMRQVVNAGRFPEERHRLCGFSRFQSWRWRSRWFQLLFGVLAANQGAQERPFPSAADTTDGSGFITSGRVGLASRLLIRVTDMVKAERLLQTRAFAPRGVISMFACV